MEGVCVEGVLLHRSSPVFERCLVALGIGSDEVPWVISSDYCC